MSRGVPYLAVIVVMLLSCLAYLALGSTSAKVLNWILNFCTAATMLYVVSSRSHKLYTTTMLIIIVATGVLWHSPMFASTVPWKLRTLTEKNFFRCTPSCSLLPVTGPCSGLASSFGSKDIQCFWKGTGMLLHLFSTMVLWVYLTLKKRHIACISTDYIDCTCRLLWLARSDYFSKYTNERLSIRVKMWIFIVILTSLMLLTSTISKRRTICRQRLSRIRLWPSCFSEIEIGTACMWWMSDHYCSRKLG